MKTPGREDDPLPEAAGEAVASKRTDILAEGVNLSLVLEALGGRENLLAVDNCITRLRLELRDPDAVREYLLLTAGAKGVFRPGGGSVQVVIGTRVQRVADALRKLL